MIKSNAVYSCNLLFKMAMYIIRITYSHPWLSMIIHRDRINLRQHVLFWNKWHAFMLNFSRNIGCLTSGVEKLKWKKLSTSFHEKYVNSLPLQMESISKNARGIIYVDLMEVLIYVLTELWTSWQNQIKAGCYHSVVAYWRTSVGAIS